MVQFEFTHAQYTAIWRWSVLHLHSFPKITMDCAVVNSIKANIYQYLVSCPPLVSLVTASKVTMEFIFEIHRNILITLKLHPILVSNVFIYKDR